LAEDLVRLRSAKERRRYLASQRSARIDPNPHQIDAVIFALERVRDGGCILADEVGLGKTIEAGLVISQLLAEGARRVLLVAPKPLLGQWREELLTLFALSVTEGSSTTESFDGTGVFVASRDLVGSVRGSDVLSETAPFDLVVVDEAHEVFSGIYKRYDKWGNYREDGSQANMAHRLRTVLQLWHAPVLLLTATPIQNSLTELWGLVQYVEPTGTLLGDLRTFRETFCPADDRRLLDGQEDELRSRLSGVCQRTLRRQAQEFLERPFVAREARLYEYTMSSEEKALYDEVTAYLLSPGIVAFRGASRQLLLIGYHRQMASSHRALAASLQGIAQRLERIAERVSSESREEATRLASDLEDDDLVAEEPTVESDQHTPEPEQAREELKRVRDYVARARALGTDSKALALIKAAKLVLERGERGQGSGKLVIFTESLATQDYLAELLLESRIVQADDVTLFRGNNDGPRVAAAFERWRAETGNPPIARSRSSRDIAIRLALVHEFRTRSRIFISTESGAKGLNLQFCETLVNYDLPWNPQRIEQRIGRCHRYGQRRDVTVINFLASDNEAQRLTFDILSRKMELFGDVLDASDAILHKSSDASSEALVSAMGPEFEHELRRIHERARTLDERDAEMRELRERMTGKREVYEETHRRTVGLIQSRLDTEVQRSFRDIEQALPQGLAELDRELERLVTGYLASLGASHSRSPEGVLHVAACERLPGLFQDGARFRIGGDVGEGDDRLHVAHPLVQAAVAHARAFTPSRLRVAFGSNDSAPRSSTGLRGAQGRLVLVLVRYPGFEPVEHLLLVAIVDGREDLLSREEANGLLASVVTDLPPSGGPPVVSDADMDDAVEEAIFKDREPLTLQEQERFERALGQVERFVEDRVLVLRRQRDRLVERQRAAEQRRDAAVGSEARSKAEQALRAIGDELEELLARLNQLQSRDDEEYSRWKKRSYERRFEAPTCQRLFDAEFEVQ
jgi:adenine-specific DNA-methyltransferase